jgi:hypothetical protein
VCGAWLSFHPNINYLWHGSVLVDLEKKRYILGGLLKFAEVPYRYRD